MILAYLQPIGDDWESGASGCCEPACVEKLVLPNQLSTEPLAIGGGAGEAAASKLVSPPASPPPTSPPPAPPPSEINEDMAAAT